MAKRNRKNNSKEEEYTKLLDAWMDYSEEITERIKNVTQEKTREYEDLYNIWTEYVQDMTKQVSGGSPKDSTSFKEMQKLWTNNFQEMGERFQDLFKGNEGPYTDLYEVWTQYSQKMGTQITDLLGDSMKDQKDVYEIWMDTFGIKDNFRNSGFSMDSSDINRFWMNMWEKSQNMYSPLKMNNHSDVSQHLKDLHDLWMGTYNNMVMDFVKSPQFAQMNGNILDTNLDIKSQNQEIVNQYLESMGFPTKENIDEIYLKLHDMDRKLSKISRDVKTRRSSNRK